MITDATWADVNNDHLPDLILCGEYMPIKIFINKGGKFIQENVVSSKGWWNTLAAVDLDGDGDIDIVGGNHGLNSRFKASPTQPIKLYVNDFDQNGTVEEILTSYREKKEFPFALKHDLIAQMPAMKKKYLKYASFAGQTIQDYFPPNIINASVIDSVDFLQTAVFYNDGTGHFTPGTLPIEAQFSPVYGSINSTL